MKRLLIILLCLLLLLSGCTAQSPIKVRPLIVTTNFPAYDFARAVAGDTADIVMLIPAGTDAHTFEPSPEDMKAIKNADLFICTGGESDTWFNNIIPREDENRKIIKMLYQSNTVPVTDKVLSDTHDHSHEHEYDEHVWLAPDKAVYILNSISNSLSSLFPENSDLYSKNCENYCEAIMAEADETKEVVRLAKHSIICVADRFPYKYFCDYYALSYVAAFSSCDTFADADAETVVKLINRVREKELSFVFYNNNGSGTLAKLVCAETGVEALTLHSVESVTKEQFDNKITYIDIMKQNRLALERGLG